MKRLSNVHPGEVLNEEFLLPLGMSQNALARAMKVPPGESTKLSMARAPYRPIRLCVSRSYWGRRLSSGLACRPTTISRKRPGRICRICDR